MNLDYWAGATWVYQADITNDGANAGNHSYSLTPGAGNEVEILYGTILNGDTSARTVLARIDDDSNNTLTFLISAASTAAGSRRNFPSASAVGDDDEASAGARLFLSGGMVLLAQVQSVAVSQDSAFGIACRVRGGLPTVTLTSPTNATETVNTNQVF